MQKDFSVYGIMYYCVLSKKGILSGDKDFSCSKERFLCSDNLYIRYGCELLCTERPINSLLPVHTHPHKSSRQGQNNHNTLFYGKQDSSEILLVGKHVKAATLWQRAILDSIQLLLSALLCSFFSVVSGRTPFSISFLKLRMTQALGNILLKWPAYF